MITERNALESQVADILFELEEIIVGDKPFSLTDYRDENDAWTPEYLPVPAYQNVALHKISPLDEY
jgi:hypothetical protein